MLSHLRFHRRGPTASANSPGPESPTAGGHEQHQGSGLGLGLSLSLSHQSRNHSQNHRQPTSPLSTRSASTISTSNSAQFVSDKTPTSTTASPSQGPGQGDGQRLSPVLSSLPPTLPPIARVASPPPDLDDADPHHQKRNVEAMSLQPENNRSVNQSQRSPYNNMESGFIGGVALQKYRRDLQAQAEAKASNRNDHGEHSSAPSGAHDGPAPRQRPVPTPINTSTGPSRPPPQVLPQPYGGRPATSSFVTPTDLQNAAAVQTGRRPAGTRLTSEPPSIPATNNTPEPHKSKKGLPFLKNPMSTLLMRRKNSQNAPDLLPLPLANQSEEFTYDPRIKGTRIHDFSAPRRKRQPLTNDALHGESRTVHGQPTQPQQERQPSVATTSPSYLTPAQSHNYGVGPSESTLAASSEAPLEPPGASRSSSQNHHDDTSTLNPASTQPVRPSSQRNISGLSIKSSSSRYSDTSTVAPSGPTGSTRTGRSRNISLSSEVSSRLSGVPKHMKSTSSRFSFDMIGATKQEQILEERHRQREAERKVIEDNNPRDSRFDDFDEDSFDYDAMMDDDGLEEKIPGVNADYDEDDFYIGEDDYPVEDINEEDINDPDNDQENFAGFSFQRSNGTSPLAASHNLTPAEPSPDANATLTVPESIPGSLSSKDTLRLPDSALPAGTASSDVSQVQQISEDVPAGLGIQGVGLQDSTEPQVAPPQSQAPKGPRGVHDEDLYFDDGMVGFEDEFAEDLARSPSFDETPFDESIFDNNDTDQYGRPIAGAFAQAQSERQAANKSSTKRESDMTSPGFSAESDIARSTAHTSLSVSGQPKPQDDSTEQISPEKETEPGSATLGQGSEAAYQAALAAAARDAAASGKFQWSSSPAGNKTHDQLDEAFVEEPQWNPDDYDAEDDDYGLSYETMDDFDVDDDAIIAEANASALANDSDGWYGQEFGFYSAPVNAHHAHHGSSNSVSSSQDNDYQYANGGFFGPKGMDGMSRSKSGRVVSREPNLTPITERSEYSNRNSIMSMAMPGFGFGTPIQSPGLAQLAMMGDRGDEMSLSSLMRLRSRAWGGSQASQPSSKEGSPKSDRGDAPFSPWSGSWGGYPSGGPFPPRRGSFVSSMNYESEPASASGSPTVTMGMSSSVPLGTEFSALSLGSGPARLSSSSQPERLRKSSLSSMDHSSGPVSAGSGASPADLRWNQDGVSPSGSGRRSGLGHQQRNSTDSISYKKEGESGESRWVVERRRVAESGQVEMAREVIADGRI